MYWSDPSGADAKGYMSGGKLVAAHFTGQEAIDAYNQLVNGTTASTIEIAVEMTYDTEIIPDGNGGGGDGDGGGWLSKAWSEVKSWFGGQSKSVTIGPFEEDSSNPFLIFWGDFTGASRVMQIHLEAQAVSTNSDGSTDWRGYAAYTLMQEKITNPGGLEIGRNLFGRSPRTAKTGANVLSKGELLRIENAATRINKPITVVGSRASGTAGAYSDWDYIIKGGLKSREWSKIKNSLPGARSTLHNTPRNIDILPGPVWSGYPHITIYPR